jgi:hypothetical protein
MGMDDIQLKSWKQLIHKRRNRKDSRDLSERERQGGITEDKGLLILVPTLVVCKDKHIVTAQHQVLTKRGYSPYSAIDHGKIVVGKKRDMHCLLRWFKKAEKIPFSFSKTRQP